MRQTKRTGDLAEHIVALAALRRGWAVLLPFGDRHAYDVAVEAGFASASITSPRLAPYLEAWHLLGEERP